MIIKNRLLRHAENVKGLKERSKRFQVPRIGVYLQSYAIKRTNCISMQYVKVRSITILISVLKNLPLFHSSLSFFICQDRF